MHYICHMLTGKLHVQVNGESGESSAFIFPFEVPLSEWCQLSVALQGRLVSNLSPEAIIYNK